MEYVTVDGLSVVCCKGKYSELKLPINFITIYFTAKSRSLRQKELSKLSLGLEHTTFWVYFSEFSFAVMLYISHNPFWGQTCLKQWGVTCLLPLHVCIYISEIRRFGGASRYLPQYWQDRAVTLQACLLPLQGTDIQHDSYSAKKSRVRINMYYSRSTNRDLTVLGIVQIYNQNCHPKAYSNIIGTNIRITQRHDWRALKNIGSKYKISDAKKLHLTLYETSGL